MIDYESIVNELFNTIKVACISSEEKVDMCKKEMLFLQNEAHIQPHHRRFKSELYAAHYYSGVQTACSASLAKINNLIEKYRDFED